MRIMDRFIAKDPGQQVGAGHVDMAVWFVVHFVGGWGMEGNEGENKGEAVITQG